MTYLKAFLAGFVSTLVFHQGLLAFLHGVGATAVRPYAMRPMPPLHVPQVISLAFWGGVWGILLWLVIGGMKGSSYWLAALLVGAIAPSVVAWFVVFPLHHLPVAGGWKRDVIVGALLLNAAWGFGVALLMRLFRR
jgi:hypothetical protein